MPTCEVFLLTVPGGDSFADHLCLVFVKLWRLFIVALWSPAGSGLTFLLWLFGCCFCRFPVWYPGSSVVPDCIDS